MLEHPSFRGWPASPALNNDIAKFTRNAWGFLAASCLLVKLGSGQVEEFVDGVRVPPGGAIANG